MELLPDSASAQLLDVMRSSPIAKPDDHQGDSRTDMFTLALPVEVVDTILQEVLQAIKHARLTSGTQNRGLGGFAEAWSECASFLSSGAEN